MPRQQFDASLKDVIEAHAAAEKAMLIDSGGPQWILHPELLSGRDLSLPRKICFYNSAPLAA